MKCGTCGSPAKNNPDTRHGSQYLKSVVKEIRDRCVNTIKYHGNTNKDLNFRNGQVEEASEMLNLISEWESSES